MENILRLQERIQIAIESGEGHFTEFKSGLMGPAENKKNRDVKDICKDISKTLVAFANADGGILLVGVEDNGDITGLNYNESSLKALRSAPKNYVLASTPLPSTRSSIVEIDGKKVLFFSVQKGTDYVYITSEGKCLQRRDLESVPIDPKVIQFQRNEIRSREYDREFVDGASIADLDLEKVNIVAKDFSKTISAEKYLQHLDLAEFEFAINTLRIKRAALLLFGKDTQKWHPRCQVRVLRVSGDHLKSGTEYNVIKDEEVSGNIFDLIESSWLLLRPYLTETKLTSDAKFKSKAVFPELACREALINAIAHRDYNIEGRGIEVFIYDEKLEIKSPGELLSSIFIKDIEAQKGVHQSRNALIARVLREAGYMRELGEGFRRIYELMENNDLTPPVLYSGDQSFIVQLNQKLIYSTEEKIWLENFEKIHLTKDERTVVRLGANGELISPRSIWDSVGIVDTEDYRQLIENLRNKKVLFSEVSKNDLASISKSGKYKNRKDIPRFRIVTPDQFDGLEKNKKKTERRGRIKPRKEIVRRRVKKKIEKIDDSDYAKIFIHNIGTEIDERELENYFSKHGSISDVKIPKSRESGISKGFGFIEFDSRKDVDKLLKENDFIFIKNRKVYINKYKNK